MMPTWKAISKTEHANKHFIARQGYSFAAKQQVVPILLAELTKLIPLYAIGFIHQQEAYIPVVLTGIGGEQNLFVNADGKWIGSYVPAVFRGYPFALADNKGEKVLCIEETHLSDSGGQPLFDSEGNLTKLVQDTLNFLNECEKNRRVTQKACAALNKVEVIEKWPLKIKQQKGQEPVQVNGLYRISEQALNELDAESFAGLRKNGALALAYSQLFSMNQIDQLVQWAKFHAQQAQAQQEPDIEQLFGNDDTLHFDKI
jgi:hypothetical protein